jgi:integrase
MHRPVDLRAAGIEALFDEAVIADPDTPIDELVDQVGHVNRGKRGPKSKIVVEPRPDKCRKIKKLRMRYHKIRRSLEIDYNPDIPVMEHSGVRMQVALFKQELRRGSYVRTDPMAMRVEDVLLYLLDTIGKRNPKRALTLANHAEQLNELLAGRRLGELDGSALGEEYWEFRGGQQIKTQLKCEEMDKRKNAAFASACAHLRTLTQAIILVCKRGRVARFEFDMPEGYIEEVEWLTWPEFVRILLAAKGLIWDPKENAGRGGWKMETYVDARGRTRRRHVLVPRAQRRRSKMMIRFLWIYFCSGTRYSQILKMRWRPSNTEPYVDFDEKEIVRDSRLERMITNKRRETSAMLTVLLRQLEKYLEQDRRAGLVGNVVHQPGSIKPYTDVDHLIEEIAKRAGLPHFTAHMAKHSGVTHLASLGFTSAAIAGLYSTTADVIEATYTHLSKYFQHKVVAAADAKGFGSLGRFGKGKAADAAAGLQ